MRQRRIAGVRPKRGHNFDHRLRNLRSTQIAAAEAKAYDPDQAAFVADLLARFDVGERLREDVEQELWLQLLEGRDRVAITESMPGIRREVAGIELGPYTHKSLDAPIGPDTEITLGGLIDDRGQLGDALPPSLRVSPKDRADERAAQRLATLARRTIRSEVRKAVASAERRIAKAEREAARRIAVSEAKAEREAARRIEAVATARRARLAAWNMAKSFRRERDLIFVEGRRFERLRVRDAKIAAEREAKRLRLADNNLAQKDGIYLPSLTSGEITRAFYWRVRQAALRQRRTFDSTGWSVIRSITHGMKHRRWWESHPEAKDAMRERNARMWVVKRGQIVERVAKSTQEWWNEHPEERTRRGEIMRQVWARRRAAQQDAAA